mgnify:CR=1 FL=1
MGRKGYPVEFRRRVLDLIEAGRPVAEIAQDLGISDQTIYNWRRQDRIDRGLEHGASTAERTKLAAARRRYPGRRLWAVWQPRSFSRTRLLLSEFAESFAQADRVVALDIYRSREAIDPTLTTAAVVERMEHPNAVYIADRRDAADYLLERIRPDDVILTLGAGDGDAVGRWVLEGLQHQRGIER